MTKETLAENIKADIFCVNLMVLLELSSGQSINDIAGNAAESAINELGQGKSDEEYREACFNSLKSQL